MLKRLSYVLIALGVCAAGLRAQQQFTLISTILDPEKGTPVETLAPADVYIAEDGVDAKVTRVDAVVRTVKVQVLIDNGVGLGQNLSEVRNGVRGLVEKLPQDVETTIVTTAPQPRFLVRATKSRDELLKGVDRLTLDSATGRFTESLIEGAERALKDKDTFTVFIAAGTTSGDRDIRETHTKRLVEVTQGKPLLIHVVIYNGERSASGGDMQIEIGTRISRMTGGRYELINNLSRYATLLPELGAEVAKQATGNTRQFRITAQRPNGKSGPLGKLTMSAGARVVTSVRVE